GMAPGTCPADRPNRLPRSDSDGNTRRLHRLTSVGRGASPSASINSLVRGRLAAPVSSSQMSEVPTPWGKPAPVPPAPPERDYEPIHPGSGREPLRDKLKRWLGPIGAGLILLVTKIKAVLLPLPKPQVFTPPW